MSDVSFKISVKDRLLVNKIMKRVKAYTKDRWLSGGLSKDAELSLRMDLIACHANGNPMDFQRLLDADDFNLAHDVFGIRNHINRESGKLTGFFSPRMSKREKVAA